MPVTSLLLQEENMKLLTRSNYCQQEQGNLADECSLLLTVNLGICPVESLSSTSHIIRTII